MVSEGIDCAAPIRDANAVRRASKEFVCRYLAPSDHVNGWKRLSLGEAKRLREAGLSIVTVFEGSGRRTLDGRLAGEQDARTALAQLRDCGLPRMPVFFAVDFDARPEQQASINAYLRGAADVLTRENVGVYGGYHVVRRALDSGVCVWAWQTYAWSGGQWDPRAQLQQYRNSVWIGKLEVDLDRATVRDYGQWPRPSKSDDRPHWAKEGDKLAPMWAWFLWKDHGAPARWRPKQVPARVPKWWWARYAIHRGSR